MFSRRAEERPAALCGKRHFAVASFEQGGLRRSPAVGQRRWRGMGLSQVGEDHVNHCRILDAGDDFDGTAALTSGFDVDVEHALEALCPRHGRTAFGLCGPRTGCLGRAAPTLPGRRHPRTVGAVGGKHAAVAKYES